MTPWGAPQLTRHWQPGQKGVWQRESCKKRSKRRTETGCMGRGDQGPGHRPSCGLIHALHRAWVRRGVCVCPMRGTGGGGGVMVAGNCSGGGGAAVDREEVNDGERQKEDRD